MRYLSAEEILALHDLLIEQIGGSLGVRDEHLLRSIAEKPRASFGGTEQFPTLFLKAAAYLESIATFHVFIDGNKRTAITVANAFLEMNGGEVTLSIDETEAFILAVAQKQLTLSEIALWLEKHAEKE